MKKYIEHLQGLSKSQLILLLAQKKQAEAEADSEKIAIVGNACKLPGNVNSLSDFYNLLLRGNSVIERYVEGPPGIDGNRRWEPEEYYQLGGLPYGAYLNNIELNPEGEHLSKEELLHIDPQHRILIQSAKAAIANSGLEEKSLNAKKVGIFSSLGNYEHLYTLGKSESFDIANLSFHAGIGNAPSGAIARLATELGINGPAITIDTACSSGLSAVHLAKTALRNRECDWAIVAASQINISPITALVYQNMGFLSTSGKSQPFSQHADGHVRSEGAVAFLLCRQDVLGDTDVKCQAWLKGSAIDQHGKRTAIVASSGVSQKRVVSAALKDANEIAENIDVVEAQATGSRLSTLVELESLHSTFNRERPLYLGSCKANVGHTETISGLVSICKMIAILNRECVPGQINCEPLECDFPWKSSPLVVNTRAVELEKSSPLLGGVSSFGFTGTNAHAILEAPESKYKF